MPRALGALLLLALTGCYGWVRQRQDIYTVLNEQPRTSIRVELRNGHRVEMLSPQWDGDFIIGYRRALGARQEVHELREFEETGVTVRVDDIVRVDLRHFSAWRTVATVVGIGLVAPLAAGYVVNTYFPLRPGR